MTNSPPLVYWTFIHVQFLFVHILFRQDVESLLTYYRYISNFPAKNLISVAFFVNFCTVLSLLPLCWFCYSACHIFNSNFLVKNFHKIAIYRCILYYFMYVHMFINFFYCTVYAYVLFYSANNGDSETNISKVCPPWEQQGFPFPPKRREGGGGGPRLEATKLDAQQGHPRAWTIQPPPPPPCHVCVRLSWLRQGGLWRD